MKQNRASRHQLPPLPREPDLAALPRVLTFKQCEQVHRTWWGPGGSHRTLEASSLPRRIVGGVAVVEARTFFEWAQERFNAAPLLAGGRTRSQVARDPLADAAE